MQSCWWNWWKDTNFLISRTGDQKASWTILVSHLPYQTGPNHSLELYQCREDVFCLKRIQGAAKAAKYGRSRPPLNSRNTVIVYRGKDFLILDLLDMKLAWWSFLDGWPAFFLVTDSLLQDHLKMLHHMVEGKTLLITLFQSWKINIIT